MKARIRWIEQDFELADLKSKIKPENGVRLVSKKVSSYENKELYNCIQQNKDLVNEYNRIVFEI